MCYFCVSDLWARHREMPVLRTVLAVGTLAAGFSLLPLESATACHNNGSGRDPHCGVPAPVAAAGLPALFTLAAGMVLVLRRRKKTKP